MGKGVPNKYGRSEEWEYEIKCSIVPRNIEALINALDCEGRPYSLIIHRTKKKANGLFPRYRDITIMAKFEDDARDYEILCKTLR